MVRTVKSFVVDGRRTVLDTCQILLLLILGYMNGFEDGI